MEDQHNAKRQNTNDTPPRPVNNDSKQPSIVSPPTIDNIAKLDGKPKEPNSNQPLQNSVAGLSTDNAANSPLRQEKEHQPKEDFLAALISKNASDSPLREEHQHPEINLSYVRVGNGDMYLLWATNEDAEKTGFEPTPFLHLPWQEGEEAKDIRRAMGCNCVYVDRSVKNNRTKRLTVHPNQTKGWKAVFCWNRFGLPHEEFIQTALTVFHNLLVNPTNTKNIKYNMVNSQVNADAKTTYPPINDYITDHGVSQVINYVFYRQFLRPDYKTNKTNKFCLPKFLRLSFYRQYEHFRDFFFAPNINGNHREEAIAWGYPKKI